MAIQAITSCTALTPASLATTVGVAILTNLFQQTVAIPVQTTPAGPFNEENFREIRETNLTVVELFQEVRKTNLTNDRLREPISQADFSFTQLSKGTSLWRQLGETLANAVDPYGIIEYTDLPISRLTHPREWQVLRGFVMMHDLGDVIFSNSCDSLATRCTSRYASGLCFYNAALAQSAKAHLFLDRPEKDILTDKKEAIALLKQAIAAFEGFEPRTFVDRGSPFLYQKIAESYRIIAVLADELDDKIEKTAARSGTYQAYRNAADAFEKSKELSSLLNQIDCLQQAAEYAPTLKGTTDSLQKAIAQAEKLKLFPKVNLLREDVTQKLLSIHSMQIKLKQTEEELRDQSSWTNWFLKLLPYGGNV